MQSKIEATVFNEIKVVILSNYSNNPHSLLKTHAFIAK